MDERALVSYANLEEFHRSEAARCRGTDILLFEEIAG